jgi:uncharacterized membrane protein
MRTIYRFALAFVLLLLVDSVYLGIIGGPAIRMFEKIQGSRVAFNYAAAAIVYAALAYLVTLPAAGTVAGAAALGAATYAVYDFTNLAIFNNYTAKFALMDTAWGGALFAIVSTLLRKAEAVIGTA